MHMIRKMLLILLVVLLPSAAQAKWNADWKQRQKVELMTTADGVEVKETLTAVAVAVRLHTGNFQFADAKPDGSDIRFVAADDKTLLKHTIERYDATSELAVIWVQVPTLAPSSATQFVWLYHGNPNAPAAADESKAVFGASSSVFNFSETEGLPKDSGGNAQVPASGPARLDPAGLMGGAASFAGQPMVLPDTPALKRAPGAAFAVSLWLKPGVAPSVTPGAGGAAKASLFRQGGAKGLDFGIEGTALRLAAPGAQPVSGGTLRPDVWQHVALVAGNGKLAVYLDGKEVATAEATLPEIAGEVRIGDGLQGQIDALQLLSSAPSADAISLAALAQGPDSIFASVVPEGEAQAAGEHSYIGILVGNLTTDAWVVIVILGVMFVVAVWVMVGKARFVVGRTDTATTGASCKRFRDAGDDSLTLDRRSAHSATRRSTASTRPACASCASALPATRWAVPRWRFRCLDQCHQGRRRCRHGARDPPLNAQMVLLTIAISGGPFLGLLGTVVGVMITFAAIAAAGDVNVNAIAPGIAAALLATVAGLAVAIPALFGYNYLASRIKNISADMQIFVDEFVTRSPRPYGAR